jgi:hypothetical protein
MKNERNTVGDLIRRPTATISRRSVIQSAVAVSALLVVPHPVWANTSSLIDFARDLDNCADEADTIADYLYGLAAIFVAAGAFTGTLPGFGAGLVVGLALAYLASQFQGVADDYRNVARQIRDLCDELDEIGPGPEALVLSGVEDLIFDLSEFPWMQDLAEQAALSHSCLIEQKIFLALAVDEYGKGEYAEAEVSASTCKGWGAQLLASEVDRDSAMDTFLESLETDFMESSDVSAGEDILREMGADELDAFWSDEFLPVIDDALEKMNAGEALRASIEEKLRTPMTFEKGYGAGFKSWRENRRENGAFSWSAEIEYENELLDSLEGEQP